MHIEAIRDEARLLARIVDDLRTIALAEVHDLPLQHIPVDVATIASSTAAAFGAVAAAAGSHVVAIDDGPAMVAGDPDRIRQVLAALVDNALRHVSQDGEVSVHTTVTAGLVTVRVLDNGPGLGRDPARVFERFYRADPVVDRTAGHAGLGLTIVRALVEALDGEVWAANRPEGGAQFTVLLPGMRAEGIDEARSTAERPSADAMPPGVADG